MSRDDSTGRIEITELDPLQALLNSLARHWGLILAYGLVTIALGIMVLVWPKATLLVIAVLFALQLLINGVFQLVSAFAVDAGGGMRALLGILGALSILLAFLFLRSPFRTLAVIALLIGIWWLLTGIIELVAALSAGSRPGRGWQIAMAILSIVAGIYVLLQPAISLFALTIILGVWLVLYGLTAVIASFGLRSATHAGTS